MQSSSFHHFSKIQVILIVNCKANREKYQQFVFDGIYNDNFSHTYTMQVKSSVHLLRTLSVPSNCSLENFEFFLFYLISFDDFKNSAQRFFPVVGVVVVKQMFFFIQYLKSIPHKSFTSVLSPLEEHSGIECFKLKL